MMQIFQYTVLIQLLILLIFHFVIKMANGQMEQLTELLQTSQQHNNSKQEQNQLIESSISTILEKKLPPLTHNYKKMCTHKMN